MSQDTDTTDAGEQAIHVGETDDGGVTLPVVEVLTGRGFVTGKSGSGKSNTTSVVVEELLDAGYPVLIVDSDGEYYGLKEEYEMLHAGADEECDIQVNAEHAEKIAAIALEQNVPTILDVSGYLDDDEADELIRETARHLFAKEKKLKKPFLLVVEECHEYIPEGGGMGETGKMLIKVGKRGRKHGLGIVGISQRPADVKKDFITQANWLVWHRLTWENDTNVVGRIVGPEYGDAVPDLAAGEAFVQTDWTDAGIRRVQFKRKRTFDAGATPGLDDFERPELKSVSDALVGDLQEISDVKEQEENRVARLESELERKDERIASLKSELESARDISAAARKMANALRHGDIPASEASGGSPRAERSDGVDGAPEAFAERLDAKNAELRELRAEVERLEVELAEAEAYIVELEAPGTQLELGELPPRGDAADDRTADDGDRAEEGREDRDGDGDGRERRLEEYRAELRRKGERLRAMEEAAEAEAAEAAEKRAVDGADAGANAEVEAEATAPDEGVAGPPLAELVEREPVAVRVAAARRESQCNETHTRNVVRRLATDAPLTAHELEARVDVSVDAIHSLLAALRSRSLVSRDAERRYRFDRETLERLVEADDDAALGELSSQWRSD